MAEPNEDDDRNDGAKAGGRRPDGESGHSGGRGASHRAENPRGSSRGSGPSRSSDRAEGSRPRRDGDARRDGAPGRAGDSPRGVTSGRSGAPRRDGGPRRDGASGRDAAPRRDGGPRREGSPDRDRRPRSGGDASGTQRRSIGQSGAFRGGRPDTQGGRGRDEERRASRPPRDDRPRHDDPELPLDVRPADLDKAARFQLKTLTAENAEWVAKHLVMAARTIDEDPALAHRHALSAARRAGRIAIVRETVGITAYATGDFGLALRELRTYRRISGSNEQLALMVDSERGLGRSDRGIELARSVEADTLSTEARVALAIALSGARLDLGQAERALVELEIPELNPSRAYSYSPDLFHAYAEVLEELGRQGDAQQWRARAEAAEEALDEAAGGEIIEVIEEPLGDDAEEREGGEVGVDGDAVTPGEGGDGAVR